MAKHSFYPWEMRQFRVLCRYKFYSGGQCAKARVTTEEGGRTTTLAKPKVDRADDRPDGGSTDPPALRRKNVQRILAKTPSLAAEIQSTMAIDEKGDKIWRPDIERVRNLVLKLARGHLHFELSVQERDDPDAMEIVPPSSMLTTAIINGQRRAGKRTRAGHRHDSPPLRSSSGEGAEERPPPRLPSTGEKLQRLREEWQHYRATEARTLYAEMLEEQKADLVKRFEAERLDELATPIAKAWRRDGVNSRIAGSSFFRWVASVTWPGEVTDKELLEFAMSRGG